MSKTIKYKWFAMLFYILHSVPTFLEMGLYLFTSRQTKYQAKCVNRGFNMRRLQISRQSAHTQILEKSDFLQFLACTFKWHSLGLCKMCALQVTCGSWRAPPQHYYCCDSEEVFSLLPVKHKLLQLLHLRFSHLSIRFATTLTSEQVQSHCNNINTRHHPSKRLLYIVEIWI